MCELCRADIARIDTEDISFPWEARQFLSVDPDHGARPPFMDGVDWEVCKCPMGPHRPFMHPEKVLTHGGYYHIPNDELMSVPKDAISETMEAMQYDAHKRAQEMAHLTLKELREIREAPKREPKKPEKPTFICECCGREFGHKTAHGNHQKACKRKLNGE